MTIEEAVEIINEMTPCASCQYRNTGCKRKDKHVWSDGFCHTVDEAIALIMETLGIDPIEPNDEEPYTPNNDETEPNDNGDNEGTEPDDGNDEGDEEP